MGFGHCVTKRRDERAKLTFNQDGADLTPKPRFRGSLTARSQRAVKIYFIRYLLSVKVFCIYLEDKKRTGELVIYQENIKIFDRVSL